MLPRGAPTQRAAAEACLRAGAARWLPEEEISPQAINREVQILLHEPAYREGALKLRDEIARMPGPAERVTLLEELARDKTPIAAPH
jgi:UDP:flavonoid glycosyltransferase YjiC (YdhE family)